jgi:hypothetical protein
LSWDAFQQAVLAELGLVPYQVRVPGVRPARPDPVPAASPLDVSDDERMLARLAYAAACPVEVVQGLAVVQALLPRLRQEPQAKRALWPHLRALRRERR